MTIPSSTSTSTSLPIPPPPSQAVVYWEYTLPSVNHSSSSSSPPPSSNTFIPAPSHPSPPSLALPDPSIHPHPINYPPNPSRLLSIHPPSPFPPLRLSKRPKHRRHSTLHTPPSSTTLRPLSSKSAHPLAPPPQNLLPNQNAFGLTTSALSSLKSHLHRRVSGSVALRSENLPALVHPALPDPPTERSEKGKQRASPNKGPTDALSTYPPRQTGSCQPQGPSGNLGNPPTRGALQPRPANLLSAQSLHPLNSSHLNQRPDSHPSRPCPPSLSRTTCSYKPPLPPHPSRPLLNTTTSKPHLANIHHKAPDPQPFPGRLAESDPWDVDEDAEFGDLLVQLVDPSPVPPKLPGPPRRSTVPVSPWTSRAQDSGGAQRAVNKVLPVSKAGVTGNGPTRGSREKAGLMSGTGAGLMRDEKQVGVAKQMVTTSIRYPAVVGPARMTNNGTDNKVLCCVGGCDCNVEKTLGSCAMVGWKSVGMSSRGQSLVHSSRTMTKGGVVCGKPMGNSARGGMGCGSNMGVKNAGVVGPGSDGKAGGVVGRASEKKSGEDEVGYGKVGQKGSKGISQGTREIVDCNKKRENGDENDGNSSGIIGSSGGWNIRGREDDNRGVEKVVEVLLSGLVGDDLDWDSDE